MSALAAVLGWSVSSRTQTVPCAAAAKTRHRPVKTRRGVCKEMWLSPDEA